MRVTNKMLSNSFLADMRTNLEYMQKLQQQMTSGKEIRKPSDDPFKVARAMQLHTDIDTNKQYNENINDTINWLDTTDTALGQVGDVLQRVRELVISAGNAGYSENERRAIKDEINEKIGEISQVLNTSFDGSYIFGGTRGTTKPVDSVGGTVYENAKVVNVGDLADWKGKTLVFESSPEGTLNVGPLVDDDIKDINTLAKKINDSAPVGGDLQVIPNVSDNSLMFTTDKSDVETNNITITLHDGSNVIMDKSTTVKSSSNTQLVYYKKGGGALDITDTDDVKQYNMISQKLKVQISHGVTMDYNVTASEVLQFTNPKGDTLDVSEIFNSITNHLDGKDSKGTAIDDGAIKDLVNEDLGKLTDAINNVLKIRSEVGSKQNRMDSAKDKNIDANFNMTEILSKVEDIDITEKTMEYATMQTVYLASLQTSAKVIQPSLLDYLR